MKTLTQFVLESKESDNVAAFQKQLESCGITQISGDRIDSTAILPLGKAEIREKLDFEKLHSFIENEEGEHVDVPVSKIRAIDFGNSFANLLQHYSSFDAKEYDKKRPKMFERKGLYYIGDGHHRTLNWLLHNPKANTIPIKLVEVDDDLVII